MAEKVLNRVRYAAIRTKCRLLGCAVAENYPACWFCGADVYDDADFVQYGKLDPLFRLYRHMLSLIRRLGPRRCAECGKKFMRGYNDILCSEECHDNWLPF